MQLHSIHITPLHLHLHYFSSFLFLECLISIGIVPSSLAYTRLFFPIGFSFLLIIFTFRCMFLVFNFILHRLIITWFDLHMHFLLSLKSLTYLQLVLICYKSCSCRLILEISWIFHVVQFFVDAHFPTMSNNGIDGGKSTMCQRCACHPTTPKALELDMCFWHKE